MLVGLVIPSSSNKTARSFLTEMRRLGPTPTKASMGVVEVPSLVVSLSAPSRCSGHALFCKRQALRRTRLSQKALF